MKLLSDFDGIWTDQQKEADYVKDYILDKICEISGMSSEEVIALLGKVQLKMSAEPYKYGWINNSYISCFYGEDPFSDNNAVFNYIQNIVPEGDEFSLQLADLRERVLMLEYSSLDDFSNKCFIDSTGKFKSEGKLEPSSSAKSVVEYLTKLNAEVVISSNSTTNKIEHLFSKMGYDLTNNSRIRAKGNAMKFVIDKDFTSLPEYLNVNKVYKIALRRSSYHRILIEEKPDFVIGDVFSLDIALPLYLVLNEPEFSQMRIIQKIQPHTPQWVKDFLSRSEFSEIAFMIYDIKELKEILK